MCASRLSLRSKIRPQPDSVQDSDWECSGLVPSMAHMVWQEPLDSIADAAEGSIDVWVAQLPSCLVHDCGIADLCRSGSRGGAHRNWLGRRGTAGI